MQSPRWGNDGRQHCIHLWVPCAVLVVEQDPKAEPWKFGANELAYKICIRPECRKVLT